MKGRYKNILVAVDGSEQSMNAVREAVAVAKENNAKLSILAVKEDNPYYSHNVYPQDILGKAEEIVDSLVKGETFDRMGVPKKIIIEFALEKNVDLIVIGATGVGFIESLKLGSTTRHVVKHSPCNVTVVK